MSADFAGYRSKTAAQVPRHDLNALWQRYSSVLIQNLPENGLNFAIFGPKSDPKMGVK